MAGFSAETADLFLLTDLIFLFLSSFLLLLVVVNIHCQADEDHSGNGDGSHVHAISDNVPDGESDSYANSCNFSFAREGRVDFVKNVKSISLLF